MTPHPTATTDKTTVPRWTTLPETLRQRLVAQLVPLLVRHIQPRLTGQDAPLHQEVDDE